MEINNNNRIKCNRCKVFHNLDKFQTKRNGDYYKTCMRCLSLQKISRDKNLCEHDRQRKQCKDCKENGAGGASICEHERQKSQCKICGGSSICEHERQRNTCKICGGASICEHNINRSHCRLCSTDIIKLTIMTMIKSSKQSDKKYNRYDPVNFIDKCFLKNIIEDYPTCYYEDCKVELQYLDYGPTMGTIERLNNNLGHIKSNCVICCLKCNALKKSNKV